jgi:hypothetical protein
MSKFPSIEELDGDIAPSSNEFANDDFISREKAVLGDDAQVFASAGDEVLTADAATAFPPLDASNEASNIRVSDSSPNELQQDNYLVSDTKKLSLEDSEAIKEWKARQELEIQRRDELSQTKKNETLEKAKKAIDDFYENYNSKKDDAVDQTENEAKDFIEQRDSAVAGGTSWDRIVKLIDVSDKGTKSGSRDKSRFRELLLSLKGDANAPGAGGY